MKKSDLKTGMLVEDSKGQFGLVLIGTSGGDVIVGDGKCETRTWFPLKELNDDLTHKNSYIDSVVKVWGFSNNMHGANFSTEGRFLLWERTSKLKLNDSYEAEVDLINKVVKVGCQKFSFEKIQELALLTKTK